jgi:hypothetical protein
MGRAGVLGKGFKGRRTSPQACSDVRDPSTTHDDASDDHAPLRMRMV